MKQVIEKFLELFARWPVDTVSFEILREVRDKGAEARISEIWDREIKRETSLN